ncbi:MAG: phosphatase PAP2 family protein [Verrucomicrobiota bacterium]|jgi:acid phosphatase (class A)
MNSNAYRLQHFFLPAAFLLAIVATTLRAADLHYLPDGKPDAIALLAPPPLPDSPEQKYDLVEVISVHQDCTSNELAAALSEDRGISMFYFTPVIGDIFQPGKLPVTEAFLHRIQKDTESIVDRAKNYWKRPRPYVVDPDLAIGNVFKSFSYPSGHSTESMVLALVLADLFPDKRDALIAEAREIGWHRVEIARHYPTDIYAGRVLAQAIVREMKRNPDFQHDFAEAQAEIAAAQNTEKN